MTEEERKEFQAIRMPMISLLKTLRALGIKSTAEINGKKAVAFAKRRVNEKTNNSGN